MPRSAPHKSLPSFTKPQSFHAITSAYASRFGPNNNQESVTEEARRERQKTAAEGADRYFDFATDAYLNGWGEHFHYCPFAPGDTIKSAMTFYEHRFAMLMGLKPGMKVLDVGCGVGGPAREIAKFIGCEIVGITINQRQVNKAIEMTAQAGLGHRCTFVRGDFLTLPFPDASFDAAYAIEATVHAPDLEECYKGISRVLKPGAVFGLSEWVLTKGYDPENKRHLGIRNRIERGNGISNLQTVETCRSAMLAAGFTLMHDEDYANHFDQSLQVAEHQGSSVTVPGVPGSGLAPQPSWKIDAEQVLFRPWYWALVGDHKRATTMEDWWTAFKMSKYPRKVGYRFVWLLEKLHVYPRGVIEAMTTIAYCVDSVVEGGSLKMFTPCWWFIGRKAGSSNSIEGISGNTT